MITASFFFDGKSINGFRLSGHSGSEESGRDIICAAVSSAAYMTVNTVTEVLHLKSEINESEAFLELKLRNGEKEKARDILDGFYLHISELCKMYPDFIKIERGS